MSFPESKLTKKQVKEFRAEDNKGNVYVAHVRYDDQCGNGYNTLSVTCDVYDRAQKIPGESRTTNSKGKTRWLGSCGCCHEEVLRFFPHLADAVKFHLCSSDGPMHYVANTVHFASERDCWGLLKGEKKYGSPCMHSHGPSKSDWQEKYRREDGWLPCEYIDWDQYDEGEASILELPQVSMTGEGKERELDSARRSAIWPEATDEDLTAPGLKDRLEARLPALMDEFKRVVESLGFVY